ncbi:MAG: hypothetical protein JWP91_941 [Fibrobacteres bacterium]|nr:hypothetical protein [Fibrobacterota bacterium]
MKTQSGFTLIEAMVAGIISVIIPGVVITLLHVNNSELAFNSTQLRLTQIANVVSEEIQRAAVKATFVYAEEDASPPTCPVLDPPLGDTFNAKESVNQGIVFCDKDKNVFKSFRVVALAGGIGRLEERNLGGGWNPFVVGSDTVYMDNNPNSFRPKSLGLFQAALAGHYVSFNFHYNMRVAGLPATLPMQSETFVCRNSVSRNW